MRLKFRTLSWSSACLLIVVLLTACDKQDPITPQHDLAEYTVMFYGCAGGNLDTLLLDNLASFIGAGSTEKVQATAQYKLSAHLQHIPELAGTRRLTVGPEGPENEMVLDISLPMDDPDNIAEFIAWSKRNCPARKYILCLYGHGQGFYPAMDPMTKSSVYDDNTGGEISIFALSEGIRQSDTHFQLIHFHCCLMNMLEVLGELTEVTDYTLAYGHSSFGWIDHGSLLRILNETDDMVEAFVRFSEVIRMHWYHLPSKDPMNIVLTDLRKLPAVFDVVREIADEFVATYPEYGSEYEEITDESFYRYEDEFFVDIASYTVKMAQTTYNPKFISFASRLYRTAEEAIVHRSTLNGCPDYLTWGVTFVNRGTWMGDYEPAGNYAALAFDRATGWSRWLRLNQTPYCGFTAW